MSGSHYRPPALLEVLDFDNLWTGYCEYLDDVRRKVAEVSALRDKDRILWARSFKKQLETDISTLFKGGRDGK